jgi:hypothetical protein
MRLPFTVRDRDVQGNFDWLLKRFLDTGGRSAGIRFGSGTLTWPGGSAFTNATSVTHGLGTTPAAVLVTGSGGATLVTANTVGATTFNALGCTIDGSTPAASTTITFYWLAIG